MAAQNPIETPLCESEKMAEEYDNLELDDGMLENVAGGRMDPML